ncbi:hypothetical protein NDU88_000350 [Pleurodeles waltl]|uniref:Uncharacterized protein n=1 Tax=Pleurodeles waltl TaxID=8319 RepID=A0AAV7TGG5_PLEWA|nr:hypothetical protein NDU88_000350 [Pleurodeles waltl]
MVRMAVPERQKPRRSHNMASFDDNRDTLAAELFSMKPPATRTIDRIPSKEGLRQKFIKLERLRKQELARWSHNMASFDDNRDTQAAELFSMKPPATRTIDRIPSKEGLRQKCIKLERLKKQELARWWDITTLKRYLELKQVPRGLRLHICDMSTEHWHPRLMRAEHQQLEIEELADEPGNLVRTHRADEDMAWGLDKENKPEKGLALLG